MSQADLGGKLFAYAIRYTSKEGIANPDQGQFPGKDVSARYNGNVVEADWRAVEKIGVNPSMTPKRYGYVYDSLNRLTAGYYQNPDNPYSKENTESASYDLNGNIINMYRTSLMQAGSGTATVIDNLTYAYAGNRLLSVSDAAYNFTGYEGGGAEITYDGNGNMLSMPDKGISSIKYNYLNLSDYLHVNRFGEEDITIQTLYRADGTRVSKENLTTVTGYNGSTTVRRTTEYLDGFQYFRTENLSSGGGSESRLSNTQSARAMQPQAFTPEFLEPVGTLSIKTPDLQFFATAEGFYDYTKDQYIYSYTDHLGNVRVSYGRNSAGALEIVDANDYYPFGMNHLKSGKAIFGQGSYKNYKFSGKELQETGMYDFGARMYMPDLGRWGVMDPLAEIMRRHSPYNYAYNNPVNFVDPDGMAPRRLAMANPDSPLDYQQSPSYNPNWMGMGDNVGYGDSYGFGAVSTGGNNGESLVSSSVYEDILQKLSGNEPQYFKEANFLEFYLAKYREDNDEEPVNFFGKSDFPQFHEKFKEMYDLFKNTKGDGIFRVFGHGDYGGIWDDQSFIKDPKEFDKIMGGKNKNWKNIDNMKNAVLILYVCRSGSATNEAIPLGMKISAAHPNLTVIAFRGFVSYDNSVKGMQNVNKELNSGDGKGAIMFYRGGNFLIGEAYKKFRQRFKNFQ